jgi:serine/threonine protein kinase
MREVIVPLQLNLPGIVKLIGFKFPEIPDDDAMDDTSSGAIIVTELMKNGCLQDVIEKFIKKEPTPGFGPTQFSKCVFGIAVTMMKVHEFGAIHRDLKPANVFLDDNFEPRVADFGLARMVVNAINMTMAVGSPLFMAPELYADSDEGEPYGKPVDVYAFAIMLYQMFTKKLDMDDSLPTRSPQQMMMRIMNGVRLKRQPEISDAYWDLITHCWAHGPEARWTFEGIVEKIRTSDQFALPGTDMTKYNEYRTRILAANVAVSTSLTKSMLPTKGRRSPAKDTSGLGLSISSLAESRGGIFRDEQEKAMSRSQPGSPKRTTRYDFTRSKLKGK